MPSSLRTLLLMLACGALAGCRLLQPHCAGKTQLPPLGVSPDSVGLEIFSARFAKSDDQVVRELWNDIDEQQIPAEVRRLLAQSGFRAGVVGTRPPDALSRLLKLAGDPLSKEERSTVALDHEPMVTMRAIYTQIGWRSELLTSKTYDALPLLERDGDQVRGRTYAKADCRFALKVLSETEGRVRLELTPELHYGEAQQKWAATDGVFRPEAFRPKKVFEALRFDVPLAPGQMLLVSCLPDRSGSLGHFFFTEPNADELAQKLVVVRIAQAGRDASFSDPRAERLAQVIDGAGSK
jgi:hypothetical protein